MLDMREAATAAKGEAAKRLADDLDRLCCAETETEFFNYVTERVESITTLLRDYARLIDDRHPRAGWMGDISGTPYGPSDR